MGGFFGVVSKNDCVEDLYYGTDSASLLGKQFTNRRLNHGIFFSPALCNRSQRQRPA